MNTLAKWIKLARSMISMGTNKEEKEVWKNRPRKWRQERNDIINRQMGSNKNMDLWDRIKRRESRAKKGQREEKDKMDKMDKLNLNKMAREKFPMVERKMKGKVLEEIERLGYRASATIERKEIDQAIREVRSKKYTSPQGIKMSIFNRCLGISRKEIEFIISGSPCSLCSWFIGPPDSCSVGLFVDMFNSTNMSGMSNFLTCRHFRLVTISDLPIIPPLPTCPPFQLGRLANFSIVPNLPRCPSSNQ
jgi:hypothetical protein